MMQVLAVLREVAMSMLRPRIHHQSKWRRYLQSLTTLSEPLAIPASRAASNFSTLYIRTFFHLNAVMYSHTLDFLLFVQDFQLLGLDTHCKLKHNAHKWAEAFMDWVLNEVLGNWIVGLDSDAKLCFLRRLQRQHHKFTTYTNPLELVSSMLRCCSICQGSVL